MFWRDVLCRGYTIGAQRQSLTLPPLPAIPPPLGKAFGLLFALYKPYYFNEYVAQGLMGDYNPFVLAMQYNNDNVKRIDVLCYPTQHNNITPQPSTDVNTHTTPYNTSPHSQQHTMITARIYIRKSQEIQRQYIRIYKPIISIA